METSLLSSLASLIHLFAWTYEDSKIKMAACSAKRGISDVYALPVACNPSFFSLKHKNGKKTTSYLEQVLEIPKCLRLLNFE